MLPTKAAYIRSGLCLSLDTMWCLSTLLLLTCCCAVWYERWVEGPSQPSLALSAMSASSSDRRTSPWEWKRIFKKKSHDRICHEGLQAVSKKSLTSGQWWPRCVWARCRSSRSPRRRPRPGRGWSSGVLGSWVGNSGSSLAVFPADIWNVRTSIREKCVSLFASAYIKPLGCFAFHQSI